MTAVTAQATAAADNSTAAWAVIIAVGFGLIWRHAMFRRGKGTIMGRLLAVLLAMIVIWLLFAVDNASVAIGLAGDIASGTGTLFSGLAHFLSAIIH
jgi:hypothetical protein